MEINIVLGFQKIANPFFDFIFKSITHMGGVPFFVLIFCLLYWCYDKYYAYKFAGMYGLSACITFGFKSIIKRPRPYVADFDIVNYVNESGYSMPSGHSAAIATIATALTYETFKKSNKKWFKIITTIFFSTCVFLVMLSRIYLGQHYLTDVLVGGVIGFLVAFLVSRFFKLANNKEHIYALYILPFVLAGYLYFYKDFLSTDLNLANYANMFIIAAALIIGYFLEKQYINYHVKSVWWYNFVKGFVGIATSAIIYFLLNMILPTYVITQNLIYFIIGIWISAGVMLLFKILDKLFKINKQEEKYENAHN